MRTRLLVAVSLAAFLLTPGASRTRDLTFSDRVEAQRAIERVYYSHQTGATLPFDEAVPDALLERKVGKYLKESVALEKFWSTPVTGEMLDAEIERMRRTTRMPGRLNELFAALDNERLLIRECIARPILASRLLGSFYALDPRYHADERHRAEEFRMELEAKRSSQALTPSMHDLRLGAAEGEGEVVEAEDPDANHPRLAVSEEEFRSWRNRLPARAGSVGSISEEKENFTIPVLLEEQPGRLLIATYHLPKRSREAWWREVEQELDEAAIWQDTERRSRPAPGGGAGPQ